MQAPRFLFRTGLSHLHFFTSAGCGAKVLLSTGASIAVPTGSVIDPLTTFFPSRGRQLLISPHPHIVVAVLVFLTRVIL
jgi:hypothetical protein